MRDVEQVSEEVVHVVGSSLKEILSQHAAAVDIEISAIVEEEVSDPGLRRAVGYQLGLLDANFRPPSPGQPAGGGKKLRSALVLLAYQAARTGADAETSQDGLDRALPLAAAIELLHNYSLVHDDIEDGDRWRRGRPALWVVLGEPQAILWRDVLTPKFAIS